MSFDHLGPPSTDVRTADWTVDACVAIPLAALQREAWEAKGSTISRARPAPQQSPEIPTVRTSIRCSSQCNYQLERMSSARFCYEQHAVRSAAESWTHRRLCSQKQAGRTVN